MIVIKYLQLYTTLLGHPKTRALWKELNLPTRQDAVKYVVCLWIWLALNSPLEGSVDETDLDAAFQEDGAGWQGDVMTLINAMVKTRWLERRIDGSYALRNWLEYTKQWRESQERYEHQRVLNSERQARFRENRKKEKAGLRDPGRLDYGPDFPEVQRGLRKPPRKGRNASVTLRKRDVTLRNEQGKTGGATDEQKTPNRNVTEQDVVSLNISDIRSESNALEKVTLHNAYKTRLDKTILKDFKDCELNGNSPLPILIKFFSDNLAEHFGERPTALAFREGYAAKEFKALLDQGFTPTDIAQRIVHWFATTGDWITRHGYRFSGFVSRFTELQSGPLADFSKSRREVSHGKYDRPKSDLSATDDFGTLGSAEGAGGSGVGVEGEGASVGAGEPPKIA